MEKEQRIYEIGYLLSPLVSEEKLDEEVSFLRKVIEDRGGMIISEERPKSHKLAYPIKKFETAFFGWIKFNAETEKILEIKNSFEKPGAGEQKILRFIITKAIKERIFQPLKPRILKRRKPAVVSEIKEEAKIEEIDKKLEELLRNSPAN